MNEILKIATTSKFFNQEIVESFLFFFLNDFYGARVIIIFK